MKKFKLLGVLLLSVVFISACSSNEKETKENAGSQQTSIKENNISTEVEGTKVDNTVYDSVISEINAAFDPDKSGVISSKVENNVADSEFPDGHDVIRVLVIDDEAKNLAEVNLNAVYSNTATSDQINYIYLIRQQISNIAKSLPNDTVTISFGYEKSPDNYDIIALSSKTKDIINVGSPSVE